MTRRFKAAGFRAATLHSGNRGALAKRGSSFFGETAARLAARIEHSEQKGLFKRAEAANRS
ncbi:MAG: hypothetical protein JWO28_308 [Hyphomicrobiales bacterium]|jgi:hypothetical protein|nr:hypothetical protein [Hyphomicrobiales bacterium]